MESNQVHLVAATVPGDPQQIVHALEPRFTRQIARYVVDRHGHYRIDDDVAVVHLVAATDLDVRPRPDTDAAPDPAAPDALTKAPGEQHDDVR